MTQPSYVPIVDADQVRPSYRLRTPGDWRADRVGDVVGPEHPRGRDLGVPGPDQGYALLLAHQLFEDRVVASARAGRFGRAPVAKDLEFALTLFGFLGDAPDDLVAWRSELFAGAAHHYRLRRRIVETVPDATLPLAPDEVRTEMSRWRGLLALAAAPD